MSVRIRLMGTEDECRQLAALLPEIADVLEISEPYANRGTSKLVRIYADAQARPRKEDFGG